LQLATHLAWSPSAKQHPICSCHEPPWPSSLHTPAPGVVVGLTDGQICQSCQSCQPSNHGLLVIIPRSRSEAVPVPPFLGRCCCFSSQTSLEDVVSGFVGAVVGTGGGSGGRSSGRAVLLMRGAAGAAFSFSTSALQSPGAAWPASVALLSLVLESWFGCLLRWMLHVLAADSPKSFRAGVAVVVPACAGGATAPVVSAVTVAALEAAALGASAGAHPS